MSWFGRLACAVLLAAALPAPLLAQGQRHATYRVSGVIGSGIVDGELGLTTGVGVTAGWPQFIARTLLELHLIPPPSSDYSWGFGSEGAECLDKRTYRRVDSSLCDVDRVLAGVAMEGMLVGATGRGELQLGAGYRLGSGSTAYGVLGYGFSPAHGDWNLLFRAIGGRRLLGVQAVATVPVRRR